MNGKAIGLLFLLNIAVAAAFTSPSFIVGRRSTTAVYGIGDRLKNLIGRNNNEDNVAILEREESPAAVANDDDAAAVTAVLTDTLETKKEEETMTETQKLMQQVKDSGIAGVISYALWELGFWTISVPVCVFGYRELTGHWPDFTNQEDVEKVGAEAFAFVNFARFAVPLRIGLALSTTPWIQANIVDKYMKKEDGEKVETPVEEANGNQEESSSQ